ncbi:MAG: CoA transferase [Alphaproteobacteria bacterium]|jgi:crotonobetainyl-CoA:carnitine CoA-transferase CaiB-like acyl-CoA transferase|nr:CoA transferase [Alphaproteobacteria bacterium]MBT4082739.1 CoA transferase [Alphaproteobacteria bacterium]MBT4543968.1 CoA transferase [Alphaproteobacteria bacterium]MBT6387757.1 CoA transferase [Alphaproteobacteria bacterium]MBT7745155.1 CoA transferase [Alphaproteobacteria bacterium]
MTKPLDGVRIIDLSNMLMAPYATQILGDMGADIIKVEPPVGDPIRGIGPYRNPGMGAIFMNINRSKRSIVLDLKKPDGHAAILELLKDADVLIYNRRPKVMDRLDLSYEKLSALNPRLIYAGLYGYGEDGPYAGKPAFDDLIQGAVAIPALGQMANGLDPVYTPTALVDRGVALYAVGQINAALYHQARTGQGQIVDTPMFEMMAGFVLGDHMAGYTFDPPLGPPGYKRMLTPDRKPYPTSDGYVCVLAYTDTHWRSFFRALDREAEFDADPRYASMSTRTENINSIYSDLADLLTSRTTAEWLTFFDETDIPAMPLHTPESLIADPHLQATDFFTFSDHPTEGRIREMASPSSWSETQPAPTRPVPLLGQHSAEILREAGYSDDRIEAMMESGATAAPPEQNSK